MAEYCEGTIKKASKFDEEQEEKESVALKKSMQGLGTNEATIIRILSTHDNKQRLEIKKKFKSMYGKDLIDELKDELSGNFETLVVSLLVSNTEYDAQCCYNAIHPTPRQMELPGTCEEALIQLLCPRTNEEIAETVKMYKELYKTSLEDDLEKDLSGYFRNILIAIIQGGRDESTEVDEELIRKDVEEIYEAGEGKVEGTEVYKFNKVFTQRSRVHMKKLFAAYKEKSGKDIEETLKSELSGDTKKAFLALAEYFRNPIDYFASCIFKSMQGVGTNDNALIRLIVNHCEVDLKDIKNRYPKIALDLIQEETGLEPKEIENKYPTSLLAHVKSDTGGDYRKLLMALIGPDDDEEGKK